MATAEPKDTECPGCHEDFTEPKILPCAHILCRRCLVERIGSGTQDVCPLCPCAMKDLKGSSATTSEDIADFFPTDMAMEALVHSVQTLSKDHVCCAHPRVAAASICLNCNDMMCDACANSHTKMSMSRHHQLEDMASLTAERLAANRPATCSKHFDKKCEFFCLTHGSAICVTCFASDHDSCSGVTELEESVKEARAVLAELSATLSAAETGLERAISQLDQQLLQIEESTQATVQEIEEACDRLDKSVKACRQRLKELQQAHSSRAKEEVHTKKAILVARRGMLTSHRHMVDRVDQTVPHQHVDAMKTTLQTLVNDLDLDSMQQLDMKVPPVPRVEIDPQAVSRVERELDGLGEPSEVAPIQRTPSRRRDSYRAPGSKCFRFHTNHGRNVVLSNNHKTAMWEDRRGGMLDGIVISCEPMVINTLYEVLVEKTASNRPGRLEVGVTMYPPANLTIPFQAMGWESAIITCFDEVSIRGRETVTEVGEALKNVRVGSRVGVLVDAARCLHLFVDGQDQGVAASDVSQPCYALFEILNLGVQKLTALPLTTVD